MAAVLTRAVEERVATAWPKLKLDRAAFADFLASKRNGDDVDDGALAVEDRDLPLV